MSVLSKKCLFEDKTNKRKGYSVEEGKSEQKVELGHVVGGSKKRV